MNHALTRKYFAESSLLLTACAIGVFAFCWFRVTLVSELDTAQFRQIIDLLPKDWRKFAPVDLDWLVSYLGRTASTLEEPMLIFLVGGWMMVRGSDVVSGELGRGTMEMLLAQPVSRRQVYLNHAFWTVAGLTLLTLVAWLAMSIGIWTTSVEETVYPTLRLPLIDYEIPLTFLGKQTETIAMSSAVDARMFLPGVINLWFLGWFLGGFAAMVSAFDRFRWRTLGLCAAFYFVNAGIKMVGLAMDDYRWIEQLSFFGFYVPAAVIERAQSDSGSLFQWFATNAQGNLAAPGLLSSGVVLMGLGVLFYWIGLRHFERRDLPAPM